MEQLHLISIWRHRISTQLYRICDFGFAKQLRADNGMLMTPCYTGNLFALVNYEENDKIVRNMIDIKSKLILSLDMSNLQQGLMVILNMMKINGLFRQICVKKQGLMKTFKKKGVKSLVDPLQQTMWRRKCWKSKDTTQLVMFGALVSFSSLCLLARLIWRCYDYTYYDDIIMMLW